MAVPAVRAAGSVMALCALLAGCSTLKTADRDIDVSPSKVKSTVGIKTNAPPKSLE